MPKRVKVSQFNRGIKQTPASSSAGWQGASDMSNLKIDKDGYLQIAGNYTESDIELEGNGNKLNIFHYPGTPRTSLTPVTKFYRTSGSAVNIGRRVFFDSEDGNPKWRDLVTNSEYNWEMNAPEQGASLFKTGTPIADSVYDKISEINITPNPFSNKGFVRFEILQPIQLKFTIFNLQGETIGNLNSDGTIIDTQHTPAVHPDPNHEFFYLYSRGLHEVPWKGTNKIGEPVSAGLYFVSIYAVDGNDEVLIGSTRAGFQGHEEERTEQEEQPEFIDREELVEGVGLRGGNYLVTYTYANPELGMETPPSPLSQIEVIAFQIKGSATDDSFNRAPYAIEISNYLTDLPAWADRVKFYVKRAYLRDEIRKVKDTPYAGDFIYVGGPGREDLSDNIDTTWQFANERVDPSRQYLPFTDENIPEINDFSHLTAYSARMWAWDKRTQTVRFSLIDGYGVSRYDIFPNEGSIIPHSIRFEGSWQGNATAMHVIPGSGGLYVFFEDSIGVIRGKGLISGIYSTEISPATDLDASGGLRGVGSSSPRGITDNGSTCYFVGSDKKIYALSGSRVLSTENISLDIQESLNELTDDQLQDAVLTYYETNLHLLINNSVFVYDVQRKYWTKYTWNLTDMVWSPGGNQTNSILFGLTSGGLYELNKGDIDQLEWSWVSNEIIVPDRTKIFGVFCQHTSAKTQIQIQITVDGKDMGWKWFTPTPGNKFRFGLFSRVHGNIKVGIRGVGEPPKLHQLEALIS